MKKPNIRGFQCQYSLRKKYKKSKANRGQDVIFKGPRIVEYADDVAIIANNHFWWVYEHCGWLLGHADGIGIGKGSEGRQVVKRG